MHLPKHKPQELVTQYAWNGPASLPLNVRLKAAKKSLLSQNVEYSMHCINYTKGEQEKPLLFKLTVRSRFKPRAQSLLSRAISCVWLFNT